MEDAVEGEELQKLALANKVEKERLDLIRRDEKQQLMDDNRRQIEERTALRKLQENQEDVSSVWYENNAMNPNKVLAWVIVFTTSANIDFFSVIFAV